MKKYFFIILLFSGIVKGQFPEFGQAKGLFMAVGVGPRFPISSFSENQNLGIGFNFSFSYTDNKLLPVFLYSSIGYEHYPGRQDFYKSSDYSSFSSNVISMRFGVRYFFSPIVDDIILLMPVAEVGPSISFYEKFHEFKIDRGRSNFVEEVFKGGFHIGGGFSMFLMDVMAYYNYLPHNQYISFDMKIRIPIFATL